MQRSIWLLCALIGLAALPRESVAVREFSGTTPSGAWYRIAAPDAWRSGDALVLFQHGLNFSPASDPPDLGPLEDVMLAEGYAVAASSFRQRGWALFDAIDDNRELLAVFEQQLGAPGSVLPFGGSMGGLIALNLAEADGFPPIPGVYALCPAAAGARLWDAAIDLRLAFDVVCEGAGTLPTGAAPLSWAVDLADIPIDLGDLSDQVRVAEALIALNRCTGVNLPPYLRNDAMQERLDRLMQFAHLTDEHFFVTQVGYAAFVMSDLVRAPDALDNRNPFTTAGVDYSEVPLVHAGIERLVADPDAAAELHAVSDFGGAVGTAKVLSMHTSRDELVIPGNQDFVRAVLPADQVSIAIVDEDTPTHCGFSEAEGLAGWEALRAWIAGAAQPDADDLQQACEQLVGVVDGPCRFDPDAAIVPFDAMVRPRTALTPDNGHAQRDHPPALLRSRARQTGGPEP